MADDKADPRIKRTETIRSALQKLLAKQQDEGSLATAFDTLFDALGYCTGANLGKEDIGLPKVMLTRLSTNLLQVLLLWVLQSQFRPRCSPSLPVRCHPLRHVLAAVRPE